MAPMRRAATTERMAFCWTSRFCMELMRPRAEPRDPDVSEMWPRMLVMVSRLRSSSPVMSMATCSVSWAISSAPRMRSVCCLCRIQPLVWVVLTKLENSLARSNRRRFD